MSQGFSLLQLTAVCTVLDSRAYTASASDHLLFYLILNYKWNLCLHGKRLPHVQRSFKDCRWVVFMKPHWWDFNLNGFQMPCWGKGERLWLFITLKQFNCISQVFKCVSLHKQQHQSHVENKLSSNDSHLFGLKNWPQSWDGGLVRQARKKWLILTRYLGQYNNLNMGFLGVPIFIHICTSKGESNHGSYFTVTNSNYTLLNSVRLMGTFSSFLIKNKMCNINFLF